MAKGCTRVRMIMIFLFYVLSSMSYRPPLRGPPIGGQDSDGASYRCSAPYTLCLFEAFPSRGNEKYGEEKQRVIYFMYHSAVSPFGGWSSEPVSRMFFMPYDTESQFRNADFISIAAERQSATLSRSRCRPLSEAMQPFYTTCGASRAPFKNCGEAATTTLGAKSPVKPKNLPAVRPVNPKNLFPSCGTF